MTDSSSSSSVHTNVPDVGSTRMDNVPVQVTTIKLNKENYLRWSAAITVGIAGRGRIAYVNGRKVEPVEGSIAWDTWYLEDNQVKMWIINSVSSEIQPLILRKKTARDMWVILEHMYGQKKRKVLDKDKEDISAEAHELGKKEEEVEKDVPPMVTEQEGTRMFGQGDGRGEYQNEIEEHCLVHLNKLGIPRLELFFLDLVVAGLLGIAVHFAVLDDLRQDLVGNVGQGDAGISTTILDHLSDRLRFLRHRLLHLQHLVVGALDRYRLPFLLRHLRPNPLVLVKERSTGHNPISINPPLALTT
ncbi:hypothetical protein EJ110_NYTH16700 [Nymphaea thermarum]|nr:hypothetical protein EJ110_NYTH16700 [Nymphaea thermarum]